MAKYILLLNWTEQGVKTVKDSAKRYDAAKDVAKQLGVTMETIYLTFGPYDLVVLVDAPNDEAIATFGLRVASQGNVRTTTLKAFTEAEYRRVIEAI